jgi:hypothetical protein
MNPFRRSELQNRLRVAARLHRVGQLTDPHYGALATHVLFELAGRVLKEGNSFSNVDFELAVPRALGLPTAYQWNAPELLARYGLYDRAPKYLAAGNSDTATGTVPSYTWNARTQGLYEQAVRRASRRGRLRAWAVGVRPTFKAGVGTFFWIVVTAVVTAVVTVVVTRLSSTCP